MCYLAELFRQIAFQSSGTGGTRLVPAKSKMAARGPQNGRRGPERGLTLGYFAKYVFDGWLVKILRKRFQQQIKTLSNFYQTEMKLVIVSQKFLKLTF